VRPQIFTRAREWLTSTPPTGTAVSLTVFFCKRGTNWLKFQQVLPITLGVVGVALQYFSAWWALRWAWSLMYNFFGRGCAPEIWEGQKLENFARFWTTFEFDSNILGNFLRYKNLKQTWSTTILARFRKKICKVWSANKKVLDADVDPP